MNIPVLTSQGFQRYVTGCQHAAEVAGKVLKPNAELWRTAEKQLHPVYGLVWFAYYFKPKEAQLAAWEGRRPRDSASNLLPARPMQQGWAH